jgi:hemoglobin-like flavoprotein
MTDQAPSTGVDEAAQTAAKASFDRCCARTDFFVCFYRNFFRTCPEVEPLFAHTDFHRQMGLLRHAIGLLLIFPNQPKTEPTVLTRVADRHGRADLDISPEFYGGFVEALLQTVAEHDPAFDDAVDAAWRKTIAPGIAYMQARH